MAASSPEYEVRNSRMSDRSLPDFDIIESRNRFRSSRTLHVDGENKIQGFPHVFPIIFIDR